MGFENRKSKRINVSFDIYYWLDGKTTGIGNWGKVLNLSESGMAFLCDQAIPKDDIIRVEFGSASRRQPIKLFCQVVYCERDEAKPKFCQVRIQFENLSGDDRQLLRQHVLQIADPKLAAATGWGKVYFPGAPSAPCTYSELSGEAHLQLVQSKTFISARELVYIKKFQAFLQLSLGNPNPQNFRLIGSRALKNHCVAFVELELESGPLHLLGEVMWSQAEEKERAESGLVVVGYHKAEALAVEKGNN